MEKTIEIPFGAKDSELKGWEYTIPEGMEAEIKDGKIIVKQKESEDERIRSLLVWQVHRNIEDETNDLAESVYDGIKGHDPDLEESIEDWKKCLAYLEKQKEQQPAEWSEEDENTLNDAITAVDMMLTDNYKESHPNLFKAFLTAKSWLKSLPERFNLQSKQEWSEEDEIMLQRVLLSLQSLIEEAAAPGYIECIKKEINWLKHLRDNYKKCNCRWKPSEEQMAALLNAEGLVRANNYPENAKILASLYTDLKKL